MQSIGKNQFHDLSCNHDVITFGSNSATGAVCSLAATNHDHAASSAHFVLARAVRSNSPMIYDGSSTTIERHLVTSDRVTIEHGGREPHPCNAAAYAAACAVTG